jgi:membrane-associated progesterone receptor component
MWCFAVVAPSSSALTLLLVFAGKDASRALGKTSTKPEDVSSVWNDLDEKEKGTLNDWVTFFSKRYNVIGVVEGATNME